MATNFGLANLYNVFVLGNMNMSNTDAEGRVAAGGNVTLYNYGVGAGISPLPPAGTDASLVIDGSVNISGGSNASGNTVVNPASTITAYTMGNPNGSLTTGNPHRLLRSRAVSEMCLGLVGCPGSQRHRRCAVRTAHPHRY